MMGFSRQRITKFTEEMLANSPFANMRHGTWQRGHKWSEIAEAINS